MPSEPMIRNCKFAMQCTKQWDELKHSGDISKRFCDACQREVHLCLTDKELRFHLIQDHCVAFRRKRSEPMMLGMPERQFLAGHIEAAKKAEEKTAKKAAREAAKASAKHAKAEGKGAA